MVPKSLIAVFLPLLVSTGLPSGWSQNVRRSRINDSEKIYYAESQVDNLRAEERYHDYDYHHDKPLIYPVDKDVHVPKTDDKQDSLNKWPSSQPTTLQNSPESFQYHDSKPTSIYLKNNVHSSNSWHENFPNSPTHASAASILAYTRRGNYPDVRSQDERWKYSSYDTNDKNIRDSSLPRGSEYSFNQHSPDEHRRSGSDSIYWNYKPETFSEHENKPSWNEKDDKSRYDYDDYDADGWREHEDTYSSVDRKKTTKAPMRQDGSDYSRIDNMWTPSSRTKPSTTKSSRTQSTQRWHQKTTLPNNRRSTTMESSWAWPSSSSTRSTQNWQQKPTVPHAHKSTTTESWKSSPSRTKSTLKWQQKPTLPNSRKSTTTESWLSSSSRTRSTQKWQQKPTVPHAHKSTTTESWRSSSLRSQSTQKWQQKPSISTRKSTKSWQTNPSNRWQDNTPKYNDEDIIRKSTSTYDSWTKSTRRPSSNAPKPTPRSSTSSKYSTLSTKRLNYPRTTSTTQSPYRPQRTSTTRTQSSVNPNIPICGLRDLRNTEPSRYRRDASTILTTGENIMNGTERTEMLSRIVGGTEAEPFSWPWVAALYRVTQNGGNRFLCAGSLINEYYVLTAAHVFTPRDLRSSSFVVMLGTHTAKEAVAEYLVDTVLQHPRYQNRYYYHDIALLRLERPVAFNNYVMPVCLPTPDAPLLKDKDLMGKTVTVMGWGDESFGGVTSRVLKEASFPVLSRKSCNSSYVQVASNRYPNGITANLLCAGAPDGGKDACQGDSGGPLTTLQDGRYVQVGIVSFGYSCGDKDYPGVYTKVGSYLDWIAENSYCDHYRQR